MHLPFGTSFGQSYETNTGFPRGSDGTQSNVGDLGSLPGSGISLEKGMATHSSILAWRTRWTEEPDGLQSIGSQSIGHNCATNTLTFFSKKSPEALGVVPSGIIFFFPSLSYALLCISSSSGKPPSSSHLTASKTRFTGKSVSRWNPPAKPPYFPLALLRSHGVPWANRCAWINMNIWLVKTGIAQPHSWETQCYSLGKEEFRDRTALGEACFSLWSFVSWTLSPWDGSRHHDPFLYRREKGSRNLSGFSEIIWPRMGQTRD